MSDAAYDGQYGGPISFVFTPTTGSAFGSTQAQCQELTPGDLKFNKFTFVPISGANANKEQFGLTYVGLAMVKIKATYKGTGSSEHASAQAALAAGVKGTLVVTYGEKEAA